MGKASLFFFIFILGYTKIVIAQSITGTIIDFGTKNPIPFANVYFNSSQRGTVSNSNGDFELEINGFEGQEVIVSCIGYNTEKIKEVDVNKRYQVFLIESASLLPEIVISGDQMSRKAKMRIFKKEFLGYSKIARQCIITNEDDIRLVYFKSTNTLEAYSYEPLIIQNEKLGYRITYFLIAFKWNQSFLSYRGNSLFEEMLPDDPKQISRIHKNRMKVYLGSRMHFVRYLWKEDASKKNYSIWSQSDGEQNAISERIISNGENVKYLKSDHDLGIGYKQGVGYTEVKSYLKFKGNGNMSFTQSGYFDPEQVSWEGNMANMRVGELLPYEYYP